MSSSGGGKENFARLGDLEAKKCESHIQVHPTQTETYHAPLRNNLIESEKAEIGFEGYVRDWPERIGQALTQISKMDDEPFKAMMAKDENQVFTGAALLLDNKDFINSFNKNFPERACRIGRFEKEVQAMKKAMEQSTGSSPASNGDKTSLRITQKKKPGIEL